MSKDERRKADRRVATIGGAPYRRMRQRRIPFLTINPAPHAAPSAHSNSKTVELSSTPPAALAHTDDVTATPQHEAPFKGAAGATEMGVEPKRYTADCDGLMLEADTLATLDDYHGSFVRGDDYDLLRERLRETERVFKVTSKLAYDWEARAIAAEAALKDAKRDGELYREFYEASDALRLLPWYSDNRNGETRDMAVERVDAAYEAIAAALAAKSEAGG